MRTGFWTAVAAVVLGITVWALVDAVRDFAAAPDFAGVLRLVVEAAAGAVAAGFCVGRARSAALAPPDGDGGDGAGRGQDRQEGKRRGE